MIPQSNTVSLFGRYRIGATLFVLVLLSIASTALADVVSPPPSDCFEGTQGASDHGGPYCRADACNGDAGPCDPGLSCQAVDYCVEEVTITGWSTRIVEVIRGFCNDNEPCSQGSCQTLQVCVSEDFIRDAGIGSGDAGGTKPMDASSSTPDTGTTKPTDSGSTTSDTGGTKPTDASAATTDTAITKPVDAGGATTDVEETEPKDASASTATRSDTGQSGSSDKGDATDQQLEDGVAEKKKTSTSGCGCIVGRNASTNGHLGFALFVALLCWRMKRRY